jgi:hypothetical protein
MPYRRLPNTDSARIRALKAAYVKGKELPPMNLAYSQSTYTKVELFMNSFEKAMAHYKSAYSIQVEKSKNYIVLLKKAKLYLSHFIQVLYMAIDRGEHQEKIRTVYGMDLDERKIPSLNTEKDIVDWGKKIIDGETQRIKQNQTPITNPTIAVVKVRYENFVDAFNHQKILQQNTQRYLNELNALRERADEIILSIWNEVEETLKDLPDDTKREKAAEYGVVYFYRKNEIKGLQLLEKTLFDYVTP